MIRSTVDDSRTHTAVAHSPAGVVDRPELAKALRDPKSGMTPPAAPPVSGPDDNGSPSAGDRSSGPRSGARAARPLKLFWPATLALAAGVAAVAAGGFDYRAGARFEMSGDLDASRRELLDLLWEKQSSGQVAPGWDVLTTPDRSLLEARITMPDAESARARITQLGDAFRDRLAERAAAARSGAEQADRLLDAFVASLRAEADAARQAAEKAEHAIADASPFHARETLRAELGTQIETFNLLRAAKVSIQDRLTRIDTEPLPSQGWVSPEMRAAAYAARDDLRQDMEQLRFQLTLGRRLLEDVWQAASPRLDELIAAVARLARIGLTDAARSATGPERRTLDDLLGRAGEYQRRLSTFAQQWTETFTGMRRQPIDPLAARLMATQAQLHDLLGDFLFASNKLLDEMRDDVRRLTEQTHGAARYHRLQSQAKGAFYRFESEHRQFELVASKVLRPNNFRLDASVKSAAGLHRRTQQTIDAIDAQLEQEAIAQAVARRKAEHKAAADELQQVRAGLDAAVDKIVALHSEFLLTIPQSDTYLESTLLARAARQRLDLIGRWVDERQALVEQLKATRSPAAQLGRIAHVEYVVDRTPVNLTFRLGWGLAAACATFAAMLVVTLRWRGTPLV